ncbi:class I mannose-6-phosphate isomerase [Humibacter antri]
MLGPNRPPARPYRGGEGIVRFRGLPESHDAAAERMPEDFVASATEVFSGGGVGLTVLPDGTSLRDDFAAHPLDYFGEAHERAFGADPMLLVKLLDTRERLFVHYHPSDSFARASLAHASGKTEAWIIVTAEGGVGYAYLGFDRDVGQDELLGWFQRQDVPAMLAAMNRVELRPGDTLHVPAGMPHSIGPGITLVELQQPVDLSILVEYEGYPGLDRGSALLGLDVAAALSNLNRSTVSTDRLRELRSSRITRLLGETEFTDLFPEEADAVFRAQRVSINGSFAFDAGFCVLVVLEGEGALEWNDGAFVLSRGQTVLVPHAAGGLILRGTLTVLCCRPPAGPNRMTGRA